MSFMFFDGSVCKNKPVVHYNGFITPSNSSLASSRNVRSKESIITNKSSFVISKNSSFVKNSYSAISKDSSSVISKKSSFTFVNGGN